MNVLVVDDDRKFCLALAGELARLGHKVRSANSAEEAMGSLFGQNVDILLTDLRMGGNDGIELLEYAKAASPDTRTVLMSAYATAQDYKTAISLGAIDVLTKPFGAGDLEKAVKKASECRDGFRGNIHGLTLPDILQAFSLARASVTVRVGPTGSISLQNGEVVHAVVGTRSGVEALRELLVSRGGMIETAPAQSVVPRTIHQRLDHLLIGLEVANDTASEDPIKADRITQDLVTDAEPVTAARPFVPLEMNDVVARPPFIVRWKWALGAGSAIAIAAAAFLLLQDRAVERPPETSQPPAMQQPPPPPPPITAGVPEKPPQPTLTAEPVEPTKAARPAEVVEPAAASGPEKRKSSRRIKEPARRSEAAVRREDGHKPAFDLVEDKDAPAIGLLPDEGPAVGTVKE